jgi:DNA-binding SARP family transcriptional activator
VSEGRPLPEAALELIELGQYDRLAELLVSGESLGGDEPAVGTHIGDQIRWICEALYENQEEEAWHREALSRIDRRQEDLNRILRHLVSLLEGSGAGDPSSHRIRGVRTGGDASPSQPGTRQVPRTDIHRSHQVPPTGSSDAMAVYCLGPFRVYVAGRFVDEWTNGKGKAIFKFLVSSPQHRAAKEVLMELSWPDAEPHAARNNLNVAIHGLRKSLARVAASSVVLFRDDSYLLNPDLDLWIDHEEFSRHASAGQDLERRGKLENAMHEYSLAEALYQGEFLEEDRYEDWPEPQRRSLRDLYLMCLDRLSRRAFRRQDYGGCLEVCRRIVAADACDEEAHRRMMVCWARQGLPHLALREYHVCREALAKELEVQPSQATDQLFDRIRQRHPV